MSEPSLAPVESDQLRVVVEMGDDYQPSDRLSAALSELAAALEESDDDDVQGFGFQAPEIQLRSFTFDSFGRGVPGTGWVDKHSPGRDYLKYD